MKKKLLFIVIISIFIIFISICVNAKKDVLEGKYGLNLKNTSNKIVDSDDYNESIEIKSGNSEQQNFEDSKQSEKSNVLMIGGVEEHYNAGKIKFIKNAFNFATNFASNPAGTVFTVIFDGFVRVIDFIQMAANFFETLGLETASDYTVVYGYQYLSDDGNESSSVHTDPGAGHRNMYTEVEAGYTENYKSDWQTEEPINIDIETTTSDEDKYGFSSDSLIPVIPVDMYTIASGKIELFDPNFLVVDTSLHTDESSIWFIIRKIATLAIRGLIFLVAGLLVSGLIRNAVHLVWGTVTPNEKKDLIAGINTFLTSLLLLVGTVVIIALGIYVNKMLISYNNIDQEHTELPIRVNVKEVGYSFSTTRTGFIRYMAQIQNVNLFGEKIAYTLIYLALALLNLGLAILFLIRAIFIMIASVYGIIIVGAKAIGKENALSMDYMHWLVWFLGLTSCQTILILAYSLMNYIN